MEEYSGPPPRRRQRAAPVQPMPVFPAEDDEDPSDFIQGSSSSTTVVDLGQMNDVEVEIRSPSFPTGSIVLPISKTAKIKSLKQLVRSQIRKRFPFHLPTVPLQILEATDNESKLVRLIMGGKILDDSKTLEQYKITTGTIVHCAFTEASSAPPSQETSVR